MTDRGKTSEVAIESDDLASLLDRDRAEYRVRQQITGGISLLAQPAQDLEMPWAWAGRQVVRLGAGRGDERESLVARGRHREDPSIRRQTQERPPHDSRDGELVVTGE